MAAPVGQTMAETTDGARLVGRQEEAATRLVAAVRLVAEAAVRALEARVADGRMIKEDLPREALGALVAEGALEAPEAEGALVARAEEEIPQTGATMIGEETAAFAPTSRMS